MAEPSFKGDVLFQNTYPGGEAYYSFISDLRFKLGGGHVIPGYQARYLPEAPPAEKSHINVKLVSSKGNEAIMLIIRRIDGYLISYRLEGRPHYSRQPHSEDLPALADGKWYIFKDEVVPQSIGTNWKYMNFDGSYGRLAGAAKRFPHSLDTQLGRNALDGALYNLAYSDNSTNQDKVATALLVIIQMVCEASRLQSISKKIAAGYDEEKGVQTDENMVDKYRDWLKSCKAIVPLIPSIGGSASKDLKDKLEEVRLVKLRSDT